MAPLAELLGALTPRSSGARASGGSRSPRPCRDGRRASNALFVKSIVWPPSMNTWSVTAANIIASTSASRSRLGERGLERAFGRVGRAGVDEAPVPAARAGRSGTSVRLERADGEARRVVARVARDEREAVDERERVVVGVEVGEQVRHRDEHGEARAPTRAAVARAELDAGAHDLGRGATPASSSPSTDFAMTSEMSSSSPLRRRAWRWPTGSASTRGAHEHVVAADLDVEAARVVGPQVERAARHEVEARVVPVAGDEPGLDRALVEREAEVRAAVLDRERGVVVPEHDDRQRADLGEQPARRLRSSASEPARTSCAAMASPRQRLRFRTS